MFQCKYNQHLKCSALVSRNLPDNLYKTELLDPPKYLHHKHHMLMKQSRWCYSKPCQQHKTYTTQLLHPTKYLQHKHHMLMKPPRSCYSKPCQQHKVYTTQLLDPPKYRHHTHHMLTRLSR